MSSRPPIVLRGDVYLSSEELAAAAGVTHARLTRLVRLGLVEPASDDASTPPSTSPGANRFTVETAARLRRMLRLHADLGVNFVGAAIIVDLLERLARLEAQLVRPEVLETPVRWSPRPRTPIDKENA